MISEFHQFIADTNQYIKQLQETLVSKNNSSVLDEGYAIQLLEYHGYYSVYTSDHYYGLEQILGDTPDPDITDICDLDPDSLDSIEQYILDLCNEARISWDRAGRLDSDYAGYESSYEFARADAYRSLLGALTGFTDIADDEINSALIDLEN